MKHAALLAAVATTALAVLAIRPAAATPIYNNLNSASNGADPTSSDGGIGPLADSFSTGSSGYSLASVGLKLLDSTPNDGYTVTVALYSDNATSPDALLYSIGSIDDSALSTSLADYYFNLASPYALAANTRYWIEVSSGSGNATWSWSLDLSGPGASGEHYYHSGTVWPNSGGPYQMLVADAAITSVPEPAPLALVALGSLAGLWFTRKRV